MFAIDRLQASCLFSVNHVDRLCCWRRRCLHFRPLHRLCAGEDLTRRAFDRRRRF